MRFIILASFMLTFGVVQTSAADHEGDVTDIRVIRRVTSYSALG